MGALKNRNASFADAAKKGLFRFLVSNEFYFRSQQVATKDLVRQGWFLNSHPADGCDNVRDQFHTFCLEHRIDLKPERWQISSRQVRVRNPSNRSMFVTTQVLWIDCTADMARLINTAVKLLKPVHPSESAYPLLYNLYYVPVFNYMDIGPKTHFEMAQMPKKLVDSRFTYKVGSWSPDINLHMDAPWRINEDGELVADRSISSLILSEAKGRHQNGKPFQLFTKIQASERNKQEWHFQCRREDSGLARNWLDRRLTPFLAKQFSNNKNKEEGALSFRMLGAPARVLLGVKEISSTAGSESGSITESYLDTCRSIVSNNRVVPPPKPKKHGPVMETKRPRPQWSQIVSGSQESLVEGKDFPSLPSKSKRISASPSNTLPTAPTSEATSVSSLTYSTTINSIQSAIKDLRKENQQLRENMEKMSAEHKKAHSRLAEDTANGHQEA